MTQAGPGAPHVVTPPPSNDPTTQAVARILAAAATYEAATAALAAFLAPWHISTDAIAAALRLASRGTNHTPRPRGATPLARGASEAELYYRAAYIVRAAARIQANLDAGLSLREAIGRERPYQQAHEKARRARQLAVKRVNEQAAMFGQVLGWYLNPLLNNERECIAANGHNFDVLQGTVIGWPGAVHAGCGCEAGPPWEGAGWVNDAVQHHIVYGPGKPPLPRRRKKAA